MMMMTALVIAIFITFVISFLIDLLNAFLLSLNISFTIAFSIAFVSRNIYIIYNLLYLVVTRLPFDYNLLFETLNFSFNESFFSSWGINIFILKLSLFSLSMHTKFVAQTKTT